MPVFQARYGTLKTTLKTEPTIVAREAQKQ